MTYVQISKGSHSHRFHIDSETRDKVCLCGAVKNEAPDAPRKFHNRSSEYNGYIYMSALEMRYAVELDWRLKAKEIVSWERQVKLDLQVNGQHMCNYYIDFVEHYPDGSRQFTEIKGAETDLWRLKWKIFEATFDQFKKHPDDRLLVVKQISWGSPRSRLSTKKR
jgi:hypothetical protein